MGLVNKKQLYLLMEDKVDLLGYIIKNRRPQHPYYSMNIGEYR